MALKFMKISQNLTTTNQRKSDESKYDRKLTELDIVTTRARYRPRKRNSSHKVSKSQ